MMNVEDITIGKNQTIFGGLHQDIRLNVRGCDSRVWPMCLVQSSVGFNFAFVTMILSYHEFSCLLILLTLTLCVASLAEQ